MAIRVDEDIRPLSEFQEGVSSFVQQLQETRRPIVLTQHGRGVAVLVDAHAYAEEQERLALLEDIVHASEQLDAGEGIPHDEAREMLLKRFRA